MDFEYEPQFLPMPGQEGPPSVGSSNTYVYTAEGLVLVPNVYVVKDYYDPIKIPTERWDKHFRYHRALSASTLLQGVRLTASHIVVLDNCHPRALERFGNRSPSGVPKRICWFVRISLTGGSTAFTKPFGTNFLWQLPNLVCAKIMQSIERWGAPIVNSLVSNLASTQHELRLKDWPGFDRVDVIPDYHDRMFAMAVRPAKRTIPEYGENLPVLPWQFARPLDLQPFDGRFGYGPSAIVWDETPHDITGLILKFMVDRFIDNTSFRDWNAFLAMRAVCRDWREVADGAAIPYLEKLVRQVKASYRSFALRDVIAARDAIFDAHIPAFRLICDCNNLSVYNLMRLRSNKPPKAVPPPALPGRDGGGGAKSSGCPRSCKRILHTKDTSGAKAARRLSSPLQSIGVFRPVLAQQSPPSPLGPYNT